MKRIVCSFLLISLFPILSKAQNWETLGIIDATPRTLYTDTIEPALYIAGTFLTFNGDTFGGIGKWDGYSLSHLGCGFETDCQTGIPMSGGATVNSIVRFGNDIYATGGFDLADSINCDGLARWDGTKWNSVGTGLKDNSGSNGLGFRLRVIDNELYVCGWFDSIAGVAAANLAKYNGVNWSAVNNFPGFSSSGGVADTGPTYDVAKFKGDLYVSGNFYNYPENISRIIKWDGTDWVAVGNGLTGGGVYQIEVMQPWDSLLVVGGYFNMNSDEGNYVMGWNGTNWNPLGGGTNNMVKDIAVFNDDLYVVGGFGKAGGYGYNSGPTWDSIMGLARWDGQDWCSFNTVFDNVVMQVEVFHDSLYISGNYWSINGDSSLTKLSKALPGTPSFCSNTTTIKENKDPAASITVYPNPAVDRLIIEYSAFSSGEWLSIFDMTGRRITQQQIVSERTEVDITSLSQGVYFISVPRVSHTSRFMKAGY